MRSVSRCARSRGAGEGGRGQRDGGATGTESGVSVTVTVCSTPLIRRWGCFVRSGWSRMRAPWVGSYFATEVRKFSARYTLPQIHVPMNGIECGGRHRSQSPLIRLRALFWHFVPPSNKVSVHKVLGVHKGGPRALFWRFVPPSRKPA